MQNLKESIKTELDKLEQFILENKSMEEIKEQRKKLDTLLEQWWQKENKQTRGQWFCLAGLAENEHTLKHKYKPYRIKNK